MAKVRLAHFSDIHYTLSPLSLPLANLGGKRLAGSLNYYLGGRGRRFKRVEHRIQRLLEDVEQLGVDHALCTGDVTAVSFQEEFQGCAQVFGGRLQQPQKYTVIPGNHDRYTRHAVEDQLFEQSFGTLCNNQGGFPFAKRAAPGVTLVLLDVARPTSFTDSSGYAGEAQLKKAREILTDPSLKDEFVVMGMHYGLLRHTGERDKKDHRIEDDEAVLALVDAPDVNLDLIVHGHMHRHFTVNTKRRKIICSGSATDMLLTCGYNVYEIDPASREVNIHRRSWHILQDRYGEEVTV